MIELVLSAAVAANLSTQISEAALSAYAEHSFAAGPAGQQQTLRYRLMPPLRINPGARYPLVVFLHGAGERGTDNRAQLRYLPDLLAEPPSRELYPAFVLAPQCPPEGAWVDTDWGAQQPMPQGRATPELAAVAALIDQVVKDHPIDKGRILLTGLSMGGYGTWDLATRYPERFAKVVPICGGGDPRLASRLVHVPIWAWHGSLDQAVPVQRSRQMIDAIRAAGGDPRYTELAGIGHASWIPAYNDRQLLNWMFDRPAHGPAVLAVTAGGLALVALLARWLLPGARRPSGEPS